SSAVLTHMGVGNHGLLRMAFSMGLGAMLGYAGGAQGEQADKSHRRGSMIAEAPRAAGSRSRQHERGAGITLAGTAVPAQDEAKHFKLIGTTGTGKSTAIQEIITGALARGDRAVIADPDAGYLQRFYRPERGDVVLNPFDTRFVKWDLFAEIKNPHDVEQLARSLIPDHEPQDGGCGGNASTVCTSDVRCR